LCYGCKAGRRSRNRIILRRHYLGQPFASAFCFPRYMEESFPRALLYSIRRSVISLALLWVSHWKCQGP